MKQKWLLEAQEMQTLLGGGEVPLNVGGLEVYLARDGVFPRRGRYKPRSSQRRIPPRQLHRRRHNQRATKLFSCRECRPPRFFETYNGMEVHKFRTHTTRGRIVAKKAYLAMARANRLKKQKLVPIKRALKQKIKERIERSCKS